MVRIDSIFSRFVAGRGRIARAIILVAIGLACLSLTHWGRSFWRHTKIRMAGGSLLVPCGVEGDMRPAFFDDPGKVRAIWLNGSAFDDHDMYMLGGYTALKRLNLSQTQVSSAGIRELDCPVLTWLQLRATNVDDEGIKLLAEKFRYLNDLDLCGTHITDDAVPALCRLPHLEQVNLDNTGVSDRGLKELATAPQGLMVFLRYTKVTQGGIDSLRRARPDIRCYWKG